MSVLTKKYREETKKYLATLNPDSLGEDGIYQIIEDLERAIETIDALESKFKNILELADALVASEKANEYLRLQNDALHTQRDMARDGARASERALRKALWGEG